MWYRYSPNRRWAFTGRADWLSASIGDISGGILNLSAGVNVSLFDHLGIGLNYQYFQLDVSVREDDWRGDLVAAYDGPYLYLSGYW